MDRLNTVDEQVKFIMSLKPTRVEGVNPRNGPKINDGGIVVDLRNEQPATALDTRQGFNMKLPSLCAYCRALQAAQQEGDTPELRAALAIRLEDRNNAAKWPKDYRISNFEGAYDAAWEMAVAGWYNT